jgi:hypothetical protein
MIIKIKSHKRDAFKRILEYMISDRDRVVDQKGSTFLITHNLKGKSISNWVKQYQQNELLRTHKRKDSVRLTHEILSWHRKDAKNITLQKMEDMARAYIALRNHKGMYVIVPHFDKQHCHLHICASGVEYQTGKSMRLSKADLLKLKKDIQQYQKEKYPELSNSLENHGANYRNKTSDKEYQFILRTERQTDKEELLAIFNMCYKKAVSKESFLELLQNCNLKTYQRNEKITGVVFNGQKFRFNRLGFPNEKFENLEQRGIREKNLSEMRKSVAIQERENRIR